MYQNVDFSTIRQRTLPKASDRRISYQKSNSSSIQHLPLSIEKKKQTGYISNYTPSPMSIDDDSTTVVIDDKATYPDSISDYFIGLTDGIKYDIKDLFESSARVIDKSFKLFFPVFTDNTPTSMVQPDLQSLEMRGSTINNTKEETIKYNQSNAANRMRLSSMWNDKSNASTSSINPINDSNIQTTKKISLAKLYSSQVVSYYVCDNDQILVLGEKRMIFVKTNHDVENTASVEWIADFNIITSCTLSIQAR